MLPERMHMLVFGRWDTKYLDELDHISGSNSSNVSRLFCHEDKQHGEDPFNRERILHKQRYT